MEFYVDTSALLKLLVSEDHSKALRLSFSEWRLWSSALLEVEAHRAGRRLGLPTATVDAAVSVVNLVELSAGTLAAARVLAPDSLRTLDALHLAAAMEIGDDLDGVATYDVCMAQGAAAHGLAVVAPGLGAEWWS